MLYYFVVLVIYYGVFILFIVSLNGFVKFRMFCVKIFSVMVIRRRVLYVVIDFNIFSLWFFLEGVIDECYLVMRLNSDFL